MGRMALELILIGITNVLVSLIAGFCCYQIGRADWQLEDGVLDNNEKHVVLELQISGDGIKVLSVIERETLDEAVKAYYQILARQQKDGIRDDDVQLVVRCRDCRYYYKDKDGYEMCDNSEGYDHIEADGYCSWAIRNNNIQEIDRHV